VSFDWSNYDVVAFSEIWEIKEFENINVEGYDIKTIKQRQNGRGGGTIIYAKKEINCVVLNTPYLEGIIETTGIKIGEVYFINIYRPPSGNKETFVESLSDYLNTIRGKNVLLGGDLNLNIIGGNRQIDEICEQFGLVPKISSCTRIQSGSCIDNYLTDLRGTYKVLDISIADHFAIEAEVMITVNRKEPQKYSYRQMKENNWVVFNHMVHQISISGDNINTKWDNLLGDIKSAVDTSFPKIEKTKKYLFSMTPGLKKCRDKKNKLLKRYRLGRIPKDEYIRYNNIYRKLIKTEQSKNLDQRLLEAGNCGRKKWKALKDNLLLQTEQQSITEIEVDNQKITCKQRISEEVCKHFKNCALKLTEGLPQGCDTSVIMPQGPVWQFKTTTEIELIETINSLANKKSSGTDGLSNCMLKKEKYVFARLLKPLINESINEGHFPEALKTAIVIPIFKKGDTKNLNNYRPISLLPVISKIFEKIINKQLTHVIEDGYIDENQFGFRSGHSTEDAVLKFIDKIEKDKTSKKHVVSIYIDVSKAFDSCDHQIILNKLKRTGLDDRGTNLMKSYLQDRRQIVVVGDNKGGYFVINIGVGQGTVLGPTLFKIYIMDLHLHTTLFCCKFADDSSFEAAGNTKDEVETICNIELEKIDTWFRKNKLKLHPDKSRFLIHTKDKLINLKLGDQTIQRNGYGLQEESVRMLGVEIDENLDWKIQVKKVEKKIGKANYLL